MENRCKDCVHFRDFYTASAWNGGQKADRKCCVAFLKTDDADGEACVVEVYGTNFCEMFRKRGQK